MTDYAEAIEDIILGVTADWHSGMPAKVVSFDDASRTATLLPLLRQTARGPLDEGKPIIEERDRALVQGVRILTLQSGGARIKLPVVAGDIVWMLPASRSLTEWGGGGELATPRSTRRHSLSDCVAFAGLTPAIAPTFEIEITAAGKIRIGTAGVDLMQTLVDVVDALVTSPLWTIPGTSGAPHPDIIASLALLQAKLAGLTT